MKCATWNPAVLWMIDCWHWKAYTSDHRSVNTNQHTSIQSESLPPLPLHELNVRPQPGQYHLATHVDIVKVRQWRHPALSPPAVTAVHSSPLVAPHSSVYASLAVLRVDERSLPPHAQRQSAQHHRRHCRTRVPTRCSAHRPLPTRCWPTLCGCCEAVEEVRAHPPLSLLSRPALAHTDQPVTHQTTTPSHASDAHAGVAARSSKLTLWSHHPPQPRPYHAVKPPHCPSYALRIASVTTLPSSPPSCAACHCIPSSTSAPCLPPFCALPTRRPPGTISTSLDPTSLF